MMIVNNDNVPDNIEGTCSMIMTGIPDVFIFGQIRIMMGLDDGYEG